MVCVRSAWLVLGANTLLLEDPTKGYFCAQLDLGYPAVREVVSDRPDQDGVDDRTQFMGSRVVSANITAVVGAGARLGDVADNFAPFMAPSARPVLHYVLDRAGTPERTLTLRASGYAWPIVGASQRDIQLQWVAADPIARGLTSNTVTAWAGTAGPQGRIYPRGYPRTYPAGTTASTTATITTAGDVPARPLLRVYGPITGAQVWVVAYPAGGGSTNYPVWFQPGYTIDAGHWVDVDCAQRSVLRDSDPAQSVARQLDWVNTVWPVCPVAPGSSQLSISGSNTTSATQVQAIWSDGFLT